MKDGQLWQALAPATALKEPIGQEKQDDEPRGEKDPALHKSHEVLPFDAEKVPRWHTLQAIPEAEKLPALHISQKGGDKPTKGES